MLKATLSLMAKSRSMGRMATKFKFTRKMVNRYIAGMNSDEAIPVVLNLNRQGYTATFDCLGESVETREEATAAANEYLSSLKKIKESGADSNVSLKLSQFGLGLSDDFCRENVERVVLCAREFGNFVRIDMEDSPVTQRTLDIFYALRAKYENVGIVIQAMLYRSEKDIQDILKVNGRIRLCKGAYREPKSVAFPKKADVDRNYVKLTEILLKSGIYHGIATHDPKMIDAAKEFARRENIGKDKFEFQMLYGIRRDLQEQLVRDGYRLRLYVPYGTAWYPYSMRRMAERPANLLFVLRSLFQG